MIMPESQKPILDEYRISIVRKVIEKKPLTSHEVGIARSIGFSYDEIRQCGTVKEQPETPQLFPKQLLHVIIKDVNTNEYVFDLGTVVDVFDQFILVHLERTNRSISVRPEQIVNEYKRESNIECMIVTKDGKPVRMEQEIVVLQSNTEEKSSKMKAVLFGAACLSCPILCVAADYFFG